MADGAYNMVWDNSTSSWVKLTSVSGVLTSPIEDGVVAGRYATVTSANALKVDASSTTVNIEGKIAHDAIENGNPVGIGAVAIAHGSNPTAVASGDRTQLYANRHGVLWTVGGHPNLITRTAYIADADGAQTNASIVGTINAGTKVVVTAAAVTVDYQTAGPNGSGVAVKLGFGTSTIPADSATGATGILLDHKGVPGGGGVVLGNGAGIVGIGGDDQELRLTCEDPINGGLSVTVTYYTIES